MTRAGQKERERVLVFVYFYMPGSDSDPTAKGTVYLSVTDLSCTLCGLRLVCILCFIMRFSSEETLSASSTELYNQWKKRMQ